MTDMILPSVGDLVKHRDSEGTPFLGKVTERIFQYDIKQRMALSVAVAVTLCLDRTVVH